MFFVDLIELIIEIISQFLFWISLKEGGLIRFLIADKLSIYIVITELFGIASKRGIVAINSEREESGEGFIAALK